MGREQLLDRAELRNACAPFDAIPTAALDDRGAPDPRLAELRAALAEERAARAVLDRRLTTLLAALPAGIVVLDAQGAVASCNPGAGELLGPIVPGDAWRDIVARTFAPRWDDGHDVSLVDGRRVSVATQALAGEPGQILMITDVSETRRLQEQLTHHRRLSAKTEMAAALAHQIRTPLSAALLALGGLTRDGGLAPTQKLGARRALDALRQLERLVADMLSFARGAVVDGSPFALSTLLERLACAVAAQGWDHGFEVHFDAAPKRLAVVGNLDALVNVMLNIVGNAREVTAGRGRLEIGTRRSGRHVVISFTDDGPGIPAQDRAHIFEPFFTTRGGGTGLGLSVAQAVARAHGGELSLDADHVGGARFELTLPLCDAAALATPPSTED